MTQSQSLTLQTAPTIEPVSLPDVRTHLRITTHDEDGYLTTLRRVARQHVERTTGRALLTQTWDYKLGAFIDPIVLPYPPAASVTSITYVDSEGNVQTLSTDVYELDTARGHVRRKFGQDWPAVRIHNDAITVRYVAGWTSAAAVPGDIRHAVLLLCGHWYEFREPVISGTITASVDLTVDSLLAPWVVWSHV
jgi:uncharacterized phiE125 gp8 family phage protein